MNINIGTIIKDLRAKKQITQKQLAMKMFEKNPITYTSNEVKKMFKDNDGNTISDYADCSTTVEEETKI